jgi:hypothetical protein
MYLLFTPTTENDKELFEAIVLDMYEYYSEQFAHGSFYLPVTGGGDADDLECELDRILCQNDINGTFEFQN